jgi:hypothetical protein
LDVLEGFGAIDVFGQLRHLPRVQVRKNILLQAGQPLLKMLELVIEMNPFILGDPSQMVDLPF